MTSPLPILSTEDTTQNSAAAAAASLASPVAAADDDDMKKKREREAASFLAFVLGDNDTKQTTKRDRNSQTTFGVEEDTDAVKRKGVREEEATAAMATTSIEEGTSVTPGEDTCSTAERRLTTKTTSDSTTNGKSSVTTAITENAMSLQQQLPVVTETDTSQSDRTTALPTLEQGTVPMTTTTTASMTTAATTKKTIVHNPYAKKKRKCPVTGEETVVSKFIGGAEAARRLARTGGGAAAARQQSSSPFSQSQSQQKSNNSKKNVETIVSKNMSVYDRFCCALLRTPLVDYYLASAPSHQSNEPRKQITPQSNNNNNDERGQAHSTIKRQRTHENWKRACQRLELPLVTTPLRNRYDCAALHFQSRASLVVLETCEALSQGVATLWDSPTLRRRHNRTPAGTVSPLIVTEMVEYDTSNSNSYGRKGNGARHHNPYAGQGITKVYFKKETAFDLGEYSSLRSWSVFECRRRHSNVHSMDRVGLCVVVGVHRETLRDKRIFEAMFYHKPAVDLLFNSDVDADDNYVLTPVTMMVNHIRCFQAMSMDPNPHSIPLLHHLLGRKPAKHIRFSHSDDDEDGGDDEMGDLSSSDDTLENALLHKNPAFSSVLRSDDPANVLFHLKPLNPTQSKAATTFLESKPNSISIIQGPPGTGKTTLLVNVICRYLCHPQSQFRRLMVCAPTNKAISVLASRFLAAINPDKTEFKCVLVGDGEKLLNDDKSQKDSPLRSIFVYQWKQNLEEDYDQFLKYFRFPEHRARTLSPSELFLQAMRLERRLKQCIKDVPKDLDRAVAKISLILQMHKDGRPPLEMVDIITLILNRLAAIPMDTIWRDLVGTADVLFCTLSASGGAVFNDTKRIHDLIVDEAAASTEPEICIPLRLRPNRMMIVGDPKQLPATVISQRALELGLAKSLQERLMFHLKFDHIMLDVQYRMKPDISAFPSEQFYESKLQNGENVQRADYNKGSLVRLYGGKPYVFLQTAGAEEQDRGGSHRNRTEAEVVVDLVARIRTAASQIDPYWFSSDKLRIITFYSAQVLLLKNMLSEKGMGQVVVSTVDSSQGCEADIVLISFVRSHKQQQQQQQQQHAPGYDTTSRNNNNKTIDAGFLKDDRRMNVALTRAKYQLICIGNVDRFLEMPGADTLHQLRWDAQERKVIQPYQKSSSIVFSIPVNHPYESTTPSTITTSTPQLNLFYGIENGRAVAPAERSSI